MKSPLRHAGFTLLELLVVVVIIGTLVTLTLPKLSLNRSFEQRALLNIQAFIENARNVAIKKGEPLILTLQPGKNSLALFDRKTHMQKANDKQALQSHISTLPFTLKNTAEEKTHLLLYPDATLQPFTLELSGTAHKLTYNGTAGPGHLQ